MSRPHRVLIASLVGVFAIATETEAGNRLFVGNLPFTSGFSMVDKSTGAATPVLDAAVSLDDARAGTVQTPGSTLPADSSQGIVDPGPDGYGRAGFFDVFYTGQPNDFPADSFFDVFVDFTQAGTSTRGKYRPPKLDGVVVLNSSFTGVNVGAEFPGGVQQVTSLSGEINPGQSGLSFTGLEVVQGTSSDPFATSFFDIFTELHFDGSAPMNPALPLFRITFTPVPEPASFALAAIAGLTLVGVARKRARAATGAAHPFFWSSLVLVGRP